MSATLKLRPISCHRVGDRSQCLPAVNIDVAWQKFTKFLVIIISSSMLLTQQSSLPSLPPLSNEKGDIKKIRKQRKARCVARPASRNSTVHFLLTYRLAVLLPPSEWPLNPVHMVFYLCAPTHPCKLTKRSHRLIGKSSRSFTECRRFIVHEILLSASRFS